MVFLDSTRVIDFQLTQYGKYLLSVGKMKPVYYAFFDDEVLYDSRFAGYEESQNETQDRIIKNTPILETQYVFSGRETEKNRTNTYVRATADSAGAFDTDTIISLQPTKERHYALANSLGTIRLDSDNIPAWSVGALKGEISSSLQYKQGDHLTTRIPQIDFEPISYKMTVEQEAPNEENDDLVLIDDEEPDSEMDLDSFTRKFKDGSFLKVYKDFVLLEVEEINTYFKNDNFDVEVYMIETGSGPNNVGIEEKLIPLSFIKDIPQVVNNILLDEEDQHIDILDLDPNYVEYFLDVLVDDEISPEVICKLDPENRPEDLFGKRSIECKDTKKIKSKQIYDSSVTEEDLEIPC